MANEVHIDYDSGLTLYFIIRNSAGLPWDTTGEDFESWNAMGDYDVSMTDMSGSRYMGSIPANLAAGRYSIQVFQRVGGSPADNDLFLGGREMLWNGTAEEYVLDSNGRVDLGLWLGVAPFALASQLVQADTIKVVNETPISVADIDARIDARLAAINLDHLMKTAVADNNDMTTEVPDGTVLSNIMTAGSDTSDFVPSTDSLESIGTPIAGALEITYTVKEDDEDTGDPIEGVEVWITTDEAGTNVIWSGTTDASGVAREAGNSKPFLDAGTYYFWRKKSHYNFTNPDTEIFS